MKGSAASVASPCRKCVRTAQFTSTAVENQARALLLRNCRTEVTSRVRTEVESGLRNCTGFLHSLQKTLCSCCATPSEARGELPESTEYTRRPSEHFSSVADNVRKPTEEVRHIGRAWTGSAGVIASIRLLRTTLNLVDSCRALRWVAAHDL